MVTSMQFHFVEFGLHCLALSQLCLDCKNREMYVHFVGMQVCTKV